MRLALFVTLILSNFAMISAAPANVPQNIDCTPILANANPNDAKSASDLISEKKWFDPSGDLQRFQEALELAKRWNLALVTHRGFNESLIGMVPDERIPLSDYDTERNYIGKILSFSTETIPGFQTTEFTVVEILTPANEILHIVFMPVPIGLRDEGVRDAVAADPRFRHAKIMDDRTASVSFQNVVAYSQFEIPKMLDFITWYETTQDKMPGALRRLMTRATGKTAYQFLKDGSPKQAYYDRKYGRYAAGISRHPELRKLRRMIKDNVGKRAIVTLSDYQGYKNHYGTVALEDFGSEVVKVSGYSWLIEPDAISSITFVDFP